MELRDYVHRRRASRRKLILPAVLVGLVVIGVVIVAAGIAGFGVPLVGSPEQRAVRAWLKENLPDGEWEEVRWWPAKNLWTDKEAREIYRKRVQDYAEYPGIYSDKPVFENPRLIRLKYRYRNMLGGPGIADEVFEIVDGRAEPSIHSTKAFD